MTHPDTDKDNPVNALPRNVFPIAAVLTVTHSGNDRPFCTLGNLYRILGFMTGDVPTAGPSDVPGSLSIDEAVAKCRPEILRQHPQLAAITAPASRDERVILAWLDQQAEQFVTIEPLHDAVHASPATSPEQQP